MSRGPLLIAGASGRAAAASAIRAGFEPDVIDLFADEDTKRLCSVRRCAANTYPVRLAASAGRKSDTPFAYTGGLENHPDLIDRIAANRPLYGSPGSALRLVRDPFALTEFLKSEGLPFAPVRSIADGPPRSGTWVRKPIAGSGGLGVRLPMPDDGPPPDTHFLQRFVPGRPMSAVYVSGDRGCQLVGASEQLIGTDWVHAGGFRYAGSVGLVRPADPHEELLARIGYAVHAWAGVRGLWGLDYVQSRTGPVPIEVNPRFPASVEVLELSAGESLFARHAAAFDDGDMSYNRLFACRIVGKAVYYAPKRITFPDYGVWYASLLETSAAAAWRRPDFADIPAEGMVIERGHPVLTILAEAETHAGCVEKLRERARLLDRAFRVKPKGAAP